MGLETRVIKLLNNRPSYLKCGPERIANALGEVDPSYHTLEKINSLKKALKKKNKKLSVKIVNSNETAFEKKFIGVLSEQFGGEPEKLSYETRFREDLGADDLDFMELVMALEEYFDIGVGDEQLVGITTFGAAVDLLFEIKESDQSISRW